MFAAGTEFTYKVSRTVDGRPEAPFMETYRILSVDGDAVKVQLHSEKDGDSVLDTDTSYGSYIFNMNGFSKQSQSPEMIELEGSLVYVDTFTPGMLCGGSTSIHLGRDGVAYKVEGTQMWSMGVICREIRKLVSIKVGDRVYDDIKWVEEEDEEAESDPALDEIADFKRKHFV